METHHTFCRICEALCGLEVDVEGGQVIEARPDPENVATRGFGCLKGLKQHKLYASADRLRTPERRVGDRWVEATWDEALADIGGKVASIRAAHGPDSIAMYVGTAAGFGVLAPDLRAGLHDRPRLAQHVLERDAGLRQQVRGLARALRLPVHAALSRRSQHALPDHRRRQPGRLEVELPPGPEPHPAPAGDHGARR
jgi:hypothetical protein